MIQYNYYIFGYSDYIKNSLNDILKSENVHYFDLFKGKNILEKTMHRLFVSKHIHLLSKVAMPIWAERYLENNKINKNEESVFVLYEVNPLSNKVQWIKWLRSEYPKLKIVYIFTNIITEHNLWRVKQIQNNKELFDIVMTFNENDAKKYNMCHCEGVFSPKYPSQIELDRAEESDVYFCGLEKGRLSTIIDVFEKLTTNGIKCNFNVIYADKKDRKYDGEIHYYDELINNNDMLAGVLKSKCVLELMVDRTQPGSSLRMCESVAYKKKLITNNLFASEKPFFNKFQMSIFDRPEDIDINFIKSCVNIEKFEDSNELSPIKLLKKIEDLLND